jgi:hypothetical protein
LIDEGNARKQFLKIGERGKEGERKREKGRGGKGREEN